MRKRISALVQWDYLQTELSLYRLNWMSDKTLQAQKIFSSTFQFSFSIHKKVSYSSKFTSLVLLILKYKEKANNKDQDQGGLLGAKYLHY